MLCAFSALLFSYSVFLFFPLHLPVPTTVLPFSHPHPPPCALACRLAGGKLRWVAMSNGRRTGGCTEYTWGYIDRHFSLSCVRFFLAFRTTKCLTMNRLSGILSLQVAIYYQVYTVDFSRNRMMVSTSLLRNSLHASRLLRRS